MFLPLCKVDLQGFKRLVWRKVHAGADAEEQFLYTETAQKRPRKKETG
jgi:hypothetical protein